MVKFMVGFIVFLAVITMLAIVATIIIGIAMLLVKKNHDKEIS